MQNDDNFDKIKKRHSNFHHFAKNIKEAVEVFGTQYMDGNIKRMYHGIDKEMIFDGMKPYIHTVLSTTYSQSVAIQFTNNTGLLLEIIPNPILKYFDCCWLSKYSNEGELLFIGGFLPMNFINIINTLYSWDFDEYITSLRIIDTMTSGVYFSYDQSIVHKIKEKNTFNISLLLGDNKYNNNIPPIIKKLTIRLIEHECNRYYPSKYLLYPNLYQYVDKLLHNICTNKTRIDINWKTMNVDILKEYNKDTCGYIGYSFLRKYFCDKNYESINLDFINILFPSITIIKVSNLSLICSYFLDNILKFIQKNKKIIYVELEIAKEFGYSNLYQFEHYRTKFKKVNFHCSVSSRFESKAVVIQSIEWNNND